MAYALAAIFGLVFGSFLNVCIFRLTAEEESIVFPRSHCRACHQPISWYDNIPVLSYLLLRGRCRACHQRISPVYPAVEILTSTMLVIAFVVYGPTPEFIKGAVFIMLLLVVIFTDLLERRIPHAVTILGMAVGVVLSFLLPVDNRVLEWVLGRMGFDLSGTSSSVVGSVSGALFGAGLFYAVGIVFSRLLHKDALGFGDVMLMATVGTFLGIPLTYLTILLGSVLGILFAGVFYLSSPRFRGDYHWPYGSFLGAAAICSSLGGQALFEAYLRWARIGN